MNKRKKVDFSVSVFKVSGFWSFLSFLIHGCQHQISDHLHFLCLEEAACAVPSHNAWLLFSTHLQNV